MKTLFTISLILLLSISSIAQSWQIVKQTPNLILTDVQKISGSSTAYAIGSDGSGGLQLTSILKSTDSGDTWNNLTVSFAQFAEMKNLHFHNESLGWVAGDDGQIGKTSDGGATWILVNSGISNDLTSIYFIDDMTGWATGESSNGSGVVLIKTTDGGFTWQNLSFGSLNQNASDVWFLDANIGWIGTLTFSGQTDPVIYKTTDGGLTWIAQTTPVDGDTFRTTTIRFTDPNNGWAVGSSIYTNGEVLRTTDGGSTWNIHLSTGGKYQYLDIDEQNPNNIAITSSTYLPPSQAQLYISNDGGLSFNLNQLDFYSTLYGVEFEDNQVLLSGKFSTILKSNQTASTVEQILSSTYMSSMAWLDNNTGWISYGTTHGPAPGSYKTIDGGQTWNSVPNAPGGSVVQFIDNQTGWILKPGDPPIISRTNDGGNTWASSTGGFGEYIGDMHFADANNGWIVGSDATVRKTSNGGMTWTDQSTSIGAGLSVSSVYFTDANNGFCGGGYGGGNGFIHYTNDGGTTWNPGGLPNTGHVQELSFLNSQVGYAAVYNGEIWKTTNGGLDWSVISTINQDFLDRVIVEDADTIYALAREDWGAAGTGKGYLYKSIDGGTTWDLEYESNLIKGSFGDFSIQNNQRHWLIGNHNTIVLKAPVSQASISSNSHDTEINVFPNPFMRIVEFNFELVNSHNARVIIFDSQGRPVYDKRYNNLTAGKQSLQWDSKDANNGVYFYAIETDGLLQKIGEIIKQ